MPPIYEFEDMSTGERVELHLPASQAPSIGMVLRQDGRKLRRVVSSGVQVDAGVDSKVHGYPYVSRSLPRYAAKGSVRTDYTPDGKPIIRNRNHEREICAQQGGLVRD